MASHGSVGTSLDASWVAWVVVFHGARGTKRFSSSTGKRYLFHDGTMGSSVLINSTYNNIKSYFIY